MTKNDIRPQGPAIAMMPSERMIVSGILEQL